MSLRTQALGAFQAPMLCFLPNNATEKNAVRAINSVINTFFYAWFFCLEWGKCLDVSGRDLLI